MAEVILVINAGSSSIKFSIFSVGKLNLINHGEIENVLEKPVFSIYDTNHALILKKTFTRAGYLQAFQFLFKWFEEQSNQLVLKAVGHRVVHGGREFIEPTRVNDGVMKKLTALIPLAPLHQPHNLEAIKIINKNNPDLLQVACFDTAFHRTQDLLATLFAIPKEMTDEGIIRYGFHGLSYEYIASVLPNYINENANGKIIGAHLGQGASLCAMRHCKSVATSMAFTALEGLMMGTRCGSIDPGVILYLLQQKKFTASKIEKLLYNECGLLGVSGISSDVRELISSDELSAKIAIDLFCYRAAQELGSLCSSIQGCDVIIFTAGIGENSPIIRKKICQQLEWLGIQLNDEANEQGSTIISKSSSSVSVMVIPTNEELMIAKHTHAFI